MKKLILIILVVGCCRPLGEFNEPSENRIASYGKYLVESVANEPLLLRQYPEATETGCGLADDDFIKYARKRIDYKREFQFIVFISGKPLVGRRCLKKAFIFYLK